MMSHAQGEKRHREFAPLPACQQHHACRERKVAGLAEDDRIEEFESKSPWLPSERVIENSAPAPHDLRKRCVHPARNESASQCHADGQPEGLDPLCDGDVLHKAVTNALMSSGSVIGASARSKCTGRWQMPAATGHC